MYRASLVIVRGMPGSGKSTAAQKLVKAGYTHVEADMFYIDNKTGEYKFDIKRRPAAREWTDETVANLLRSGQNVVLCGVFAQNALIQKFKDCCEYMNCEFTVLQAELDHGNIHNVPQWVLDDMAASWEPLNLQ